MEAVQTGNDLSPAVRSSGYGKPLAIGKSKSATLYRFVNRSWYRLSAGGPLLGPSEFFALADAFSALLVRDSRRPLTLEAGSYVLGGRDNIHPVTLFADGSVSVFDLVCAPGTQIDVSSPRAELARRQGSSLLAVRVPQHREAFLIDDPHPLASRIQWLQYDSCHWYRGDVSYGSQACSTVGRRLFRRLLRAVLANNQGTLRQTLSGNMPSSNFVQSHHLKECMTTRLGLKALFWCFPLLRSA